MRWRATCGVCRSCGLSFLPSHFTLSLCRFPKQSVRQSFGCCGAAHACMQCRSVGWATRMVTGQRFVSVSALPTKSKELFCSLRGRRRRLRMWMECKRLRSGNDRDHPCSITIHCLIKISQVWAISRVVMGSGKHGSHR
jgi:hypothetical protein